jgi:BON domain
MRTIHRLQWAVVALGLFAPLATAIEPPPAVRVADAELTRRIQTVLAADSVLQGRSLVVSVVDGVAVVGGPVASNEESARIAQLLRVVPDLTDVKVSAWVPTIEDPLKKQLADRLREASPPNRLVSHESRPAARVTVQRFEPPAPAVALLADPLTKSSTEPKRTDAAYSPLPAPVPAAPDGPPQYPTIPPPAVPVAPGQDVETALDAVRKGEARFARLTAEVKAGVVTVGGSAGDAADAWDFVAKVRKVPGVDRVVLARIDLP